MRKHGKILKEFLVFFGDNKKKFQINIEAFFIKFRIRTYFNFILYFFQFQLYQKLSIYKKKKKNKL